MLIILLLSIKNIKVLTQSNRIFLISINHKTSKVTYPQLIKDKSSDTLILTKVNLEH